MISHDSGAMDSGVSPEDAELETGQVAKGARTRGGWTPSGTSVERRQTHKTRGTQQGKERRRQLLDTAKALFLERGYFDVSIEDIVNEAEVARGSFYTYFDSKVDIFRVIASEVGDQLDAAVESTGAELLTGPLDRLEDANRRFVDSYRENLFWLKMLEQAAAADPEIRRTRLVARQKHVDRMTLQIEHWQRQDIVDQSIDPAATAVALISMTAGFCMWWFEHENQNDLEIVLTTVNKIWSRTLAM